MNTCKTCIFWQKDEIMFNEIVHPYRPGTYDLERMTEEETIELHGYPLRYCKHPKILFYQRPEINGATVLDGSQYKACFVTAPEFGCVLHKEKDKN